MGAVVCVAVLALARYSPRFVLPNAALPLSDPPVAALNLRLVLVSASRPVGCRQQALCKAGFAGGGLAAAGASRSTARPCGCRGSVAVVRRCALCGWSVACGQSCGVCPLPPLCFAAAASTSRAGLPVRPLWGLRQPAFFCLRVLPQVW